MRQEPAAAEAEFRRCLELDPRHAEAHCNLATLLDNKAERIEETGTDLATAASVRSRTFGVGVHTLFISRRKCFLV